MPFKIYCSGALCWHQRGSATPEERRLHPTALGVVHRGRHKSSSWGLLFRGQAKQGMRICQAQSIKLSIQEDRQKSEMQLPDPLLWCLFNIQRKPFLVHCNAPEIPIPTLFSAAAMRHNQLLLSNQSNLYNSATELMISQVRAQK